MEYKVWEKKVAIMRNKVVNAKNTFLIIVFWGKIVMLTKAAFV